ncbi:MAG TPA: aldo/keto reductase [Thermoanaerobaculia bacterium]
MSVSPSLTIQGIEVPPLLYGTAWKEDATAGLVEAAISAGFRGIDTANQRKHYDEAAVGEGIARSGVARDQLFLQTKFTYAEGQDARLPFDPHAGYDEQVRQSFESSLERLRTDRIDSFVLHGPRTRRGLSAGDRDVWRAMEQLHRDGKVRMIGVSNMAADQLAVLADFATIPPAFVQNRCFARSGWDREVRAVCRTHGIAYQGFSLLTANRAELSSGVIRQAAFHHGKTVPQVVFRFALQTDMIPLTGTTDPRHMREDLDIFDFELTDEEIGAIETVSG